MTGLVDGSPQSDLGSSHPLQLVLISAPLRLGIRSRCLKVADFSNPPSAPTPRRRGPPPNARCRRSCPCHTGSAGGRSERPCSRLLRRKAAFVIPDRLSTQP